MSHGFSALDFGLVSSLVFWILDAQLKDLYSGKVVVLVRRFGGFSSLVLTARMCKDSEVLYLPARVKCS
jgi:hypothetical protein